ncbi:TIGR01777 family oxidoreductase [Patescibacteria group bacterium AH-259-L05]|nr:TIGR01777 family oxidoreductase [Patescibacteria group bacterium AH-259-L05]
MITGGSGFIGQNLTAALLQKGYEVTIVNRHASKQKQVAFYDIDLVQSEIPDEIFSDVDAVIHLAGANIFGRWSKRKKRAIYHSRIAGTRNLVSAISALNQKPKVLISASAVGFYGDRGEDKLDESSSSGKDFLAHVCIDWEKQAREAEKCGLRTVQIRTAPVLGHGGFLRKIVPIYNLGLGGPIARGKQWFPWIHMADIVGVYMFALENEAIAGPVNACSPQQIRNIDFSNALAKVLKRPAYLRVPRLALKLVLNDLASVVLASQKVYPRKLNDFGYKFIFPNIEKALENLFIIGE